VQTWGGYLCGDADTVVAVNVTPLEVRSLADVVRARATLFRDTVSPRLIVVRGSPRAERLDGLTPGYSPAEPQTFAMVFAIARDELVTLQHSIVAERRSRPRSGAHPRLIRNRQGMTGAPRGVLQSRLPTGWT